MSTFFGLQIFWFKFFGLQMQHQYSETKAEIAGRSSMRMHLHAWLLCLATHPLRIQHLK